MPEQHDNPESGIQQRAGGTPMTGADARGGPASSGPGDEGGRDADPRRTRTRLRKRDDRRRYAEHTRQIPLFRLVAYYAVVTAIAGTLIHYVPVVRQAYLAPLGETLAGVQNPFDTDMSGSFEGLPGNLARLVTTALVMVGAILLVLPIAWVYTFARRLRYDRSLVHSLIMLPPVVAGTVMVVKNSLALAFSLAGIVAAVRFRTTVKDPKDAVHVFLVMAIGLAAGVQALDIALLLSFTFAVIVLVFWKYDLEVVSDDDTELLAVGDSNLMLAQNADGRNRIYERLRELAEDNNADGILLIHTTEPHSARQVAEVVLSVVAKSWAFKEPPRGRNGVYTLEVVVRLRKKRSAVDLLGELEDRWSPTVAAAEYLPFQS